MYVPIAELPDSLREALKGQGYGRRDIDCQAKEEVDMVGLSGEGRRAWVVLVDLATGRSETHMGSWGGANIFNPSNAVDLDTTARKIHPGMAVVKGTSGYHGTFATVYLHPDNVSKLLPAKPTITERQGQVLRTFGYKSGYRKEEWARLKVTPAEIDELVALGLVSRNKAGACQLTTEGRNAKPGL